MKCLSRRILARPLMLMPPIPMKCTCIGLLKSILNICDVPFFLENVLFVINDTLKSHYRDYMPNVCIFQT